MELQLAGGSSGVKCRGGFPDVATVDSCQLGAQLAASMGCQLLRPRCFGLCTWLTRASSQHGSQATPRTRTRMQELIRHLLPSYLLIFC